MSTSEILSGRYSCPVCPARFHDLAKKRAHIHTTHGPKPKKADR